MDFFGFTLSVWAAIGIGVFFLFLVFACTADRHDQEANKWFVLLAGLVGFVAWQWKGLSLDYFTSAPFWKAVGIYFGIGLAYSLLEFWFKIRREARKWSRDWKSFQVEYKQERASPQQRSGLTAEAAFVAQFERASKRNRIIQVELDANGNIAPAINRSELSQAIGCWTLLWPGYAVSLVLGDLLREITRKLADGLAFLSGRFVKRTFANTFKV